MRIVGIQVREARSHKIEHLVHQRFTVVPIGPAAAIVARQYRVLHAISRASPCCRSYPT